MRASVLVLVLALAAAAAASQPVWDTAACTYTAGGHTYDLSPLIAT
jgi:hypothetical protein